MSKSKEHYIGLPEQTVGQYIGEYVQESVAKLMIKAESEKNVLGEQSLETRIRLKFWQLVLTKLDEGTDNGELSHIIRNTPGLHESLGKLRASISELNSNGFRTTEKEPWTSLPSNRVGDRKTAELMVKLGFVEAIEDAFVELSMEQHRLREQLLEHLPPNVDNSWSLQPTPPKFAVLYYAHLK